MKAVSRCCKRYVKRRWLAQDAFFLVVTVVLLVQTWNLSFTMRPVRRSFHGNTAANAQDEVPQPGDEFWPKIFLLGSARAGSTALYDFLIQHPRVCGAEPRGSDAVAKEVNFFGDKKNYEEGGSFYYLSFFKNSSKCNELARNKVQHFFIDGTVTNFANSGVARRMKHTIPARLHSKLRFLLVLREPVERDRSWTAEVRKRHGQTMTDLQYTHIVQEKLMRLRGGRWEDLRHGFYDEGLQQFFHEFKPEQFLVLNYHTMVANQAEALTKILSFLEVEISPLQDKLRLPSAPPLASPAPAPLAALNLTLCRELRSAYAPHMQALYALLATPNKHPLQPAFAPFPDPCVHQSLHASHQPSVKLPAPAAPPSAAAGLPSAASQAPARPGVLPAEEPWPTVFLLGPGRTGSAALWEFLTQLPEVCAASEPGESKPLREVDFFGDTKQWNKGPLHYLSHFRQSKKCANLAAQGKRRLLVDATVSYFGNRAVAKRIKQMYPSATHERIRFIVVLREPVERDRTWSAELRRRRGQGLHDKQYVALLRDKLRWLREGRWEDLHHGFYDENLDELLQVFPKDQVLVLSYERLKANEADTLARILSFLDIDSRSVPKLRLERVNDRKQDVTPLSSLDLALCQEVAGLFAPHNTQLYSMLASTGFSPLQPPFPPFSSPCGAFSSVGTGVFHSQKTPDNSSWIDPDDAWPTLFLLGVPRTGSTALFDFLKGHPQVCAAAGQGAMGTAKQLDFFNDMKKYDKGSEYYLKPFRRSKKCASIFKAGQQAAFLDATVTYLGNTGVAKRIKETFPAALHSKLRFLAVLREPVERDRAWTSEAARRRGKAAVTDDKYPAMLRDKLSALQKKEWEDLHHGFYDENLQAFLNEFNGNQFLVLNYDTFRLNQTDSVTRIMHHFGLNTSRAHLDGERLPWAKQDEQPERPTPLAALDRALCHELAALFEPHVQGLHHLLEHQILSPWQPEFPRFQDPCLADAAPSSRIAAIDSPAELQPWPTLYHLGVPKSGSTSVFMLLRKHPQVCAAHKMDNPKHEVKEPDFFWKEELYTQGGKGLLSMFDRNPKCQGLRAEGNRSFYLDASVKYIFGHRIPQRMKDIIPASLHDSLRFVVVFREPVERDRSWSGQKAKVQKKVKTDKGYLDGLNKRLKDMRKGRRSDIRDGFYDEHLQVWWDHFRKDQLLVLSMDTMLANETDALLRIVQHFGLDAAPLQDQLKLPHVNIDTHHVTPLGQLHPPLCRELKSIYAPHLEKLYAMLDSPGRSPFQPPFPRFDDPCPNATIPAFADDNSTAA